MRLLLDMNLPPQIAEQLRRGGHDAVHVRDIGLGQVQDADVFARAAAEQRIVITHDLDFGEIVGRGGGASVILLRLRSARRAHVQQRIDTALAEAASALQSGAIVLVEDARIRIRAWPGQDRP